MNKDLIVGRSTLQINESIARITTEIDEKICDTWKINKQDAIDAINFRENLIKYLEDMIKMFKELQQEALNQGFNESVSEFGLRVADYQDILERVKNGKYD